MGDNAAQITDWNGSVGQGWARWQTDLDRLVAPYGLAALRAADLRAGESAIDIGCGCGETSVLLAKAAGPTGAVLGIDVSGPMLAVARDRLVRQSLPQLSFIEADASAASLPGARDLLFSRFGVMFFDDPVSAFRNLRRALRTGGRLAFCCWRTPQENPWASQVVQATRSALSLPEPAADPDAPGPFAFAARSRLEKILAAAGFTQVQLQAFDAPALLGDTLEQAVGTATRVGPAARLVRELPKELQPTAIQAIRRTLEAYDQGMGVAPPGAVWIVTARNP